MSDIFVLDKLRKIGEQVLKEWCKKHDTHLPMPKITWSKRLKKTAGMYYVATESITLSVVYYEQFGFERSEQTLRHELAHHINFLFHNGCSHDRTFKQICQELGGTMNRRLAGKEFADCGTNQWIPRTRRKPKFYMRCPGCGTIVPRQRLMSPRKEAMSMCRRCDTPCSEWKIIPRSECTIIPHEQK